ncbi:MAG TPA: GAF domain-containing protein [Thermoanaerobaculia bacterium]|nr:GAF domain-containing protein [Thermoanaerobaculia bacterium]
MAGEEEAVAVVLLFLTAPVDAKRIAAGLRETVESAAPLFARSLRAERRTAGMRQAVERLTALYDLSKSFGSTIDLAELNRIIARKAVDFGTAEVGSLWLLGEDRQDLVLAETVVNENYEIPSAPSAVGAAVAGDVLADRKAIRRNGIAPGDPASMEEEGFVNRSLLAVPLVEGGQSVGALTLVNKRGRHPEFTAEDEELIQDLARQAVRALHNARQYEAQKKVEELDALLTVSREITATLDLDKVMKKIVNATAALITYDQCAIAIMDRGKLRMGAISGTVAIDRKDARVRAESDLLEWVFFSGSDVAVIQDDQGKVLTDRPETEEKFRGFFQQTGFRSFHGLLLNDEEGKLGLLAFFRKRPLLLEEDKRDLLAILVNQATVAVRNAQLYKQIPLPGFLRPLAERRRKFLEIPRRRRLAWTIGAAALLILLFAVPWRLRIAGPARILPGRRAAVTAGVDGTILSVLHREGDRVTAGEIIATLDPETYRSAVADARSAFQIAESDVAKFQEAGDSAAMFEAASRRDEMKARLALEEDRFERTSLRSPVAGTIVTPRIEEKVGQLLTKGTELCVVADLGTVLAEVAIPETDASLVRAGQRVALKLNPFPTKIFRGTITRPGSHVRVEGEDSFVIAETKVENPEGLQTGMQGTAKVSTERGPIAVAIFRKPARWIWRKVWPLLP